MMDSIEYVIEKSQFTDEIHYVIYDDDYYFNHYRKEIALWMACNGYSYRFISYYYNSVKNRHGINFTNKDYYQNFKHIWIDNFDVYPISYPKFKNSLLIKYEKFRYITKVSNIKQYCIDNQGPEYNNWHIYYHECDAYVSFRTIGHMVQFKLCLGI